MSTEQHLAQASYTVRSELGGGPVATAGVTLLSLLQMSDVHVLDAASPARCEWVELLAHDPHWKPLLHMHRPYEALSHWALAAHVEAVRRQPTAPSRGATYDLVLSTGDNIDNAQANELGTYLTILAGGRTQLSAQGCVQQATAELAELGSGPWPYWCPEPGVADTWKPLGYPAIPHFVERASEVLTSPGLGLPWASLPGNHDYMRQGTALPDAAIEQIAVGGDKTLQRPAGFWPDDPLGLYVANPAAFSQGSTRHITPVPQRRAVDKRDWLAAHVACGAAGYTSDHVQRACADTVIDTAHARLILLDTNHPAGDFQGSIGLGQLAWLDQQLSEVDQDPGRIAVLVSHHGSASLTNTRGNDPERQHAQALTALAHRHPCVVAWLVGHRHLHRITAHPGPNGASRGFWEITTGSVIDWPVQTRAVEIFRHQDDSLEIVCTLMDHNAAPDSLAGLHHDLARRFAGDTAAHMQGADGDGNVRLFLPPPP